MVTNLHTHAVSADGTYHVGYAHGEIPAAEFVADSDCHNRFFSAKISIDGLRKKYSGKETCGQKNPRDASLGAISNTNVIVSCLGCLFRHQQKPK